MEIYIDWFDLQTHTTHAQESITPNIKQYSINEGEIKTLNHKGIVRWLVDESNSGFAKKHVERLEHSSDTQPRHTGGYQTIINHQMNDSYVANQNAILVL